jgi:predicted nucleotidyltransferase
VVQISAKIDIVVSTRYNSKNRYVILSLMHLEVLKIKSLLDTDLQRDDILEYLKSIVLSVLGNYPVTIYLFGSWAKRREKRTSDIDIALWYEKNIPDKVLTELEFIINESEIPYRVEIVDLTKADDKFIEKVRREGLIWKDYKKEL